ncbi:hypothetical protein K457DRAFT_131801 [Linnemannia elongata AG-77]|uniref:Transmembrane protein n=1 Tax=Linnemannia elongata AG-77 TaxID=1314771 RepID=A0A197KJ41_9FUNG|nr:hypothetical protein K457DRAFT_131801 [Linnemannia elongata AG-77]
MIYATCSKEGKKEEEEGMLTPSFSLLSLLSVGVVAVAAVVVVDWWLLSFLDGEDDKKKRTNEERCQREVDEGRRR